MSRVFIEYWCKLSDLELIWTFLRILKPVTAFGVILDYRGAEVYNFVSTAIMTMRFKSLNFEKVY